MNFKRYNEVISEAYDVGLDLLEGKFTTSKNVSDIIESSFISHYGKEGWEWIEWFIYENDYGQRGMEATDNGEPICYSYESLFDYLNNNHKINHKNKHESS
jgi:hypothetical protein